MKYNIVARNIELTDSLKHYISRRLDGLDRYSKHIINGELIIDELRGRYTAEMVLKMKGNTITVKAEQKDLYQAIDELKDILKKQLVRYEDKLRERK